MAGNQSESQSMVFNPVFEELRQAFYTYDRQIADDGSVIIKVKNTNEQVTDPQIVAQAEYAHIWFDEITAGASRVEGDNPKEDPNLTNIAFGDCGLEAFQSIENSFMIAFGQSELRVGDGFFKSLIFNLENTQMSTTYGESIRRTLLDSGGEQNTQSFYHPIFFRGKTTEIMATAYAKQRIKKGIIDKAIDVLGQFNDVVANGDRVMYDTTNEIIDKVVNVVSKASAEICDDVKVITDRLGNVMQKAKKVISNQVRHFVAEANQMIADKLSFVSDEEQENTRSSDYSFNALRSAFYAYSIIRAQDGSTAVVAKGTDMIVTDPLTIFEVEYASMWFDRITKNASRSTIGGDPKRDPSLVDIAFGEIGENTYKNVQKSFMDAYETIQNDPSYFFGDIVISNLKNSNMGTSYGEDIKKDLCMSVNTVESKNEADIKIEDFQIKTMQYMQCAFFDKQLQTKQGLLDKTQNVINNAEDAITNVKNVVAGAFGRKRFVGQDKSVAQKSNDQEMSR